MNSAISAGSRPYQLVVWGASGFTGRLVCEHIARDYQGKGIRWAMAGRDVNKLEKIKAELSKLDPAIKDVPVLVADAHDSAAVGAVLKQASVVLSTVGPFAKYGDCVVDQAVAQGTHYCDITGEGVWVKRSMMRNHEEAERKGVRIVHCCGYDSIPSDLGTLLVVDYVRKKLGKKCDKVITVVGSASGGVSGGTIASVMNMMATEQRSEMMGMSSDAYYLASKHRSKRGSARPAPHLPTYIPEAGVWGGPFVMEGINGRIVQLSAALSPQGYGSDFKYTEVMSGGAGWLGFAKSALISAGLTVFGGAMIVPPTRALLAKVLPTPGQGPSEAQRKNGHWTHHVYAVTEEESGVAPTVVKACIGDRRDPGYWSTSRMLLESGLALALDLPAIEASGECRKGGVLTPASAMGMVLVERLRQAGLRFEVPCGGA